MERRVQDTLAVGRAKCHPREDDIPRAHQHQHDEYPLQNHMFVQKLEHTLKFGAAKVRKKLHNFRPKKRLQSGSACQEVVKRHVGGMQIAIRGKIVTPSYNLVVMQVYQAVIEPVEGILHCHPVIITHPLGGQAVGKAGIRQHAGALFLRPGFRHGDHLFAREDGGEERGGGIDGTFRKESERRVLARIQLIHYRSDILNQTGIGDQGFAMLQRSNIGVFANLLQKAGQELRSVHVDKFYDANIIKTSVIHEINVLLQPFFKLYIKDKKYIKPKAIVSFSPITNQTEHYPSHSQNIKTDKMLRGSSLKGYCQVLFEKEPSKEQLASPYLSPILGDYKDMPPIFLSASESETLFDDSKYLYKKLINENHNVGKDFQKKVCHAYQIFPFVREARKSIKACIEFLEELEK